MTKCVLCVSAVKINVSVKLILANFKNWSPCEIGMEVYPSHRVTTYLTGSILNVKHHAGLGNLSRQRSLIDKLGKSKNLIDFVKDRPGHNRRCAMDISKIRNELGWKPEYSFEKGLEETIKWYLDNTEWVENCMSGEYVKYYQQNYGERAKGQFQQ